MQLWILTFTSLILLLFILLQLYHIYFPQVGHSFFLFIGTVLLFASTLFALFSDVLINIQIAVALLSLALFFFTFHYFILSETLQEQIFLILGSVFLGTTLAAVWNRSNFFEHTIHTNLLIAIMLQFLLLATRFYMFVLNQFSLTIYYQLQTKVRPITFVSFKILLGIFVVAWFTVLLMKFSVQFELLLLFIVANVAFAVFIILSEPIYATAITQNFYSTSVFKNDELLYTYNFNEKWFTFVNEGEYSSVIRILQDFIIDIAGGDYELQFFETESLVLYYRQIQGFTLILVAQHSTRIANALFHKFVQAVVSSPPLSKSSFKRLISNIFKIPLQ